MYKGFCCIRHGRASSLWYRCGLISKANFEISDCLTFNHRGACGIKQKFIFKMFDVLLPNERKKTFMIKLISVILFVSMFNSPILTSRLKTKKVCAMFLPYF